MPSRVLTGNMARAYDKIPIRIHAVDVSDGAAAVTTTAACGWSVPANRLEPAKDWFTVTITVCCARCADVHGVATGAER